MINHDGFFNPKAQYDEPEDDEDLEEDQDSDED